MNPVDPFKWRHYQAEIILLTVRWYCRYPLSFRDLEDMIRKGQVRGVEKGDVVGQISFIHEIFGMAASFLL